jgi:hypothetical protein
MGTISAGTVIATASTILQDQTNIRWPQSELLVYLSDAQREISTYKPNAAVVTSNVQIVAGTKQTLPTGGLMLVDVVRNMGTGNQPSNAIRVVAREILDAQIPDWHDPKYASSLVKHYTYTPLNPKIFYTYPYQIGGTFVEATYGIVPGAITDIVTSIAVDDIYVPALVNYVCFRAYSKDAEYAENFEAAKGYYALFTGLMSSKSAAEGLTNPNVAMAPFNPNVPGAK